MSEHALDVLDLQAALQRVAGRATSPVGKERILALRPRDNRDDLTDELATIQETMGLLDENPGWVPPVIPDARAALGHLGIEGSVLDPRQLFSIGALLTAGRVLHEVLAVDADRWPGLWARCGSVDVDRRTEDRLARTVDGAGHILDSASSELRGIRSELTRAHSRIVERLERFASGLADRISVSDASVTVRNGRYVVPVRREGRREVGGIIHDESASGATLFVEPPLAIQLMNDLKELERAEEREILRILRDHTDALRPRAPDLTSSQGALATFDSLYARARTAVDWRADAPELLSHPAEGLCIVDGRHPLLLTGVADGDVVPFTVVMEPGERTMVISGPNTGGKTVFLKAVGLVCVLAQCGVIPPVGKGTRLPLFRRFFADIGDEQSIAENLSTFSAHLANLKNILEDADDATLVLIDEMGTGTDPAEGAALAKAILETLTLRGSLTMVTSHLGALKQLDTTDSGVVNASLEFDPERMQPTYRLAKGRPGRSYGLAIARRLGLPEVVLDRADMHLSQGDVRLDDLLERLQLAEQEARELTASLAQSERATARLSAELEEREESLTQREASAERRARDEARQMLLSARTEVEEAIRQVREASAEELGDAERIARRRVEEAAARHRPAGSGPHRSTPSGEVFKVGDPVRVVSSGTRGTVYQVRDDRAVVSAKGVKLQVLMSDLEAIADGGGERPKAHASGGWSAPEATGSFEADLRGLRVDEVQIELARALDGAIIEAFDELRIIHGKGTGAVRQRVQELLKLDARVSRFRLGGPGEGGAGVTVATLR